MYVSACNIQPFTSAHVVESFYIFTLQIYPKVHATELQNTHHIRGQIAQAIKKHPNFATSIFKRRKKENRTVILTFVVLRKD